MASDFQVIRLTVRDANLRVRRAFEQLQQLVADVINGNTTISLPDTGSGPPGGKPRVKVTDLDINQQSTVGGPWECVIMGVTASQNLDISMWSAVTQGVGTISYYHNSNSTYTMTMYGNASEEIDGAGSFTLNPGEFKTVISDGSDWFSI